ncbi:superantigen-like protein SSL4 [Terriglobus aquaticus]|uniref:Uncharacterized protein n=1 Tax=Terriglobus aquaticus TaxID=940139 RepID=A0ABW9KLH1_9BACT|nr:hypothetical protein [Terriglobus aquaticus]
MQLKRSTLAIAALSTALLATACKKSDAPAPGTTPSGSQPTAASAPTGTTNAVPPPAGTPGTSPQPVAPATTASDANVAPGTVAAPPANAPVARAATPVVAAPAAPVAPAAITVPAGTRVTVVTNQSLSGEHDDVGTPFTGSLSRPVVVHGAEVFRRGTEVRGEIVSAKGRGRFKGAGYLGIALTSIGGYRVETSEYSVRAKGRGKRTAGFIGGGGGVGALIGGLAGGGKGALIGGLAGAGAGTAAGAMTGSRDVVIPAESAVAFTTRNSITVKR